MYNLTSLNISRFNTPFSNYSVSISILETFSKYLVVGTNYHGFWLYDEFENKWMRPTDQTGQISTVTSATLSNDGSVLYIGSESGLITYSLSNEGLEYQNLIGPDDGLANLVIKSLHLDSTRDILYVGTYTGVCEYDLETESITIIEDTIPREVEDYATHIASFWYLGTHYSFYSMSIGDIFKLGIDYGRMNLSVWSIITSIQENFVSIAITIVTTTVIAWAGLARQFAEKKNGNKND